MGGHCLCGVSKEIKYKSINNVSNNNDFKSSENSHKILINEIDNVSGSNIKNSKIHENLNGGECNDRLINSDNKELSNLKLIKLRNESLEDLELIESAFKKLFFMRSFENKTLLEVIKNMHLYFAQKNTSVYINNTKGNYFFIIKNGKILIESSTESKELTKGDYFGELALLQTANRFHSAKALKDTYLYCMDSQDFRRNNNKINTDNFEENKALVNSISILKNLDNDQKTILISNLINEVYDPSTVIVNIGDEGNCLYIIKEGQVECISENKVIRKLGKGEFFGEKSILHQGLRTMKVVSKGKINLYSISVEIFKNMLGEKYKDILILNLIKSYFQNSKYFKDLDINLLDKVYENFKIRNYERNEIVIKTNHLISSKIIIVIQGGIVCSKYKKSLFHAGDILFEKQVLSSKNEK